MQVTISVDEHPDLFHALNKCSNANIRANQLKNWATLGLRTLSNDSNVTEKMHSTQSKQVTQKAVISSPAVTEQPGRVDTPLNINLREMGFSFE
jgi:hypothetical protein